MPKLEQSSALVEGSRVASTKLSTELKTGDTRALLAQLLDTSASKTAARGELSKSEFGKVNGEYPAGTVVCKSCKNIAPAKLDNAAGLNLGMTGILFLCGFLLPLLWLAIPVLWLGMFVIPPARSCAFCKSPRVCDIKSAEGQRLIS